MIGKSYEHKGMEEKWYSFWVEKGYFHADSESLLPHYSIVIPPPNVTGALHMGHALNVTLQDIIIRWKRMSGYNVLWLPGTDHAGIATQNVVERQIAKEGLTRHAIGREAFIERVWKWQEQYGRRIIHQLKRLGASCDWERERFTLDEGLSKAVREVFVRLYKEGLIYRGDYIINCCPRCQTALSDLEVDHEETKGKLYYIKYPFADEDGYIVVATTRPETLLGDTAVAVNNEDERYKGIAGRFLKLPILERRIPIVFDESVDMDFGTGAVKVTPAHDPNDFEIARSHNLPAIKVITEDGKMSKEAGPYKGQERFKCRENIIKDLKAMGLLVQIKEHTLGLGHCYRCKTIVEPYLSKQWFVKMKSLSEEAIKAVRDGNIKIIPSGWENSYFDWLDRVRDWCISRQIWWGHRIPAWYCREMRNEKCRMQDGIIVSIDIPEKCPYCGSGELIQDEDVLDTWFSSALWPFSTLGWPDETKDLKVFYPTNVLITGFDIIFFWVVRMVIMGMKFMENIPFKEVYIHALVRDVLGQKMSKSKGNVVDPIEMIDKYGTDAFRFTLAAFAAQGRDIKFSEERVEGYRHFVNKIWNAFRFIFLNKKEQEFAGLTQELPHLNLSLADRWILSRLSTVAFEVNMALGQYRFNDAAGTLYQFLWHEFCDWYLEMAKPALYEDNEERKKAALSTLIYTFEVSLRLLHPIMPFLTEELWQYLPHQVESICIAKYPGQEDGIVDKDAEDKMTFVMDAVTGIRSIRGELNLPPSLELQAVIRVSDGARQTIEENMVYVTKLAKARDVKIGPDVQKPRGSATAIKPSMEIFVPLKGILDVKAEMARLNKEVKKLKGSFIFIQKKLSNEEFLAKAPKEIVEKDKGKHRELSEKIEKIQLSIEKLKQWEV